jgi:hypothetical protein
MLRRISLFFLLLFSLTAQAVDNAIKMGYNFTTVSQTVVFNNTMRAGGALTFSANAMDGGGRAPGDPFTIKLVFYNSSNQIITTVQQAYTLTYGVNTPTPYSVSTSNCGGSCTNVAYVSAQFYGKDGGYWAGNYGPYITTPSLTFLGGSNILYNPEFGVYGTNGFAQGWSSTAGWQNCALYSGAATCVVNNGAPVNAAGGGYSSTGGTTSSPAGGQTTAPPPPTYSSGITTSQQASKTANTLLRQSQSGNEIDIEQIGENNTITLRQGTGTNRMSVYANGDNNTLNLNQGYLTDGAVSINDSNTHYLNLNLSGNSNNITTRQTNGSIAAPGHYNETTVSGNSNILNLQQQGTGSKTLFTNVNGNNNTVTANQKDAGQHYLDVRLLGNGHTVNAIQEGAGNHAATINLSNTGGSSIVNMNQLGTTAQTYSIEQSCTNPAGCTTTITQGQ